MAIALARRGGTKCRKNSPQVTVFSQSGEATMLQAGSEYGLSGTVLLFSSATVRYAAVRGRTALPSAAPTNKVENEQVASLSGDFRGDFSTVFGFTPSLRSK